LSLNIKYKYIFLNDRINCIEKISKNEADFLPVEAEEAYVAYRFLKDGFRVITEIRSAEFKDRKRN
jgi:hypothetical protein